MRQKFIGRILCISLVSAAILLVIAVGFHVRLKSQLDLKKTYIASKDIKPRTKITEADLIEISVPSSYLQDYTYVEKEDIIGKYTEIQGMIPAGSPFYKSMLFDEKDLPDNPFTQLNKGQAAYSINVDVSKLGGVLKSGQRVDIHYTFILKDETNVTGCLIQNARILSIKDHKGIDIEDEESTGTPFLAILAVDEKDVSLLSLADSMGEVKLITSSSTYDVENEATLVQDSQVYAYLLQKKENSMT